MQLHLPSPLQRAKIIKKKNISHSPFAAQTLSVSRVTTYRDVRLVSTLSLLVMRFTGASVVYMFFFFEVTIVFTIFGVRMEGLCPLLELFFLSERMRRTL